MSAARVAIVGAAETTELGKIPGLSEIQLHADAALNTMADAGLGPADIDGVATAGQSPRRNRSAAIGSWSRKAPNVVRDAGSAKRPRERF